VSGIGDLLFVFALKGHNIIAQGIRPVKNEYPPNNLKPCRGVIKAINVLNLNLTALG